MRPFKSLLPQRIRPYAHPFWLIRWRLTALYASTMGIILTASAIGFYVAVAQDHRREIDHRLETVASTLHDSLEPSLDQPGQLTPLVLQILPDLCPNTADCPATPDRHVLGLMHQQGYYLRLLNLSGKGVAIAGDPPDQVIHSTEAGLHTLHKAGEGTYRQMSLPLKNAAGSPWGYLQVGSSLKILDQHLSWVRWALLLGLPLTLGLVWGASWWVAGLAIRPAYRAYRQIQQFTADAAHELRTPLAAIRLSAESANRNHRIGDRTSEAEAQAVLPVVVRQTQRLTTLVNDLLILSRLEQDDDRSAPTLIYLPDLVKDIEEEFATLALAKGINLTTVAPDVQHLTVRGHESELYRLLLNIVSNALEYTSKGGSVTIRLATRDSRPRPVPDYRYALIEVKDTGMGIALQDQAKIFDRFYRVNPDRSRHTGGSGLGLAIALAIAQAHGGNIQVKSDIGQGSCFTIQLPRAAQAKP
ncbi:MULTISPECIES: two-component system sensor histidine kinase RppB [Cyanophyceae]|uniref:two-component system sensor histidine kinase RppB n=1 Tax=Cyanophyceae TaxID=3028117 RepID=UPI001688C9E0|nr:MULTISPECIES: two-component system sensor histidine kinase RppB [Cyanophyceae]MBD1918406.1 HAMP domain-containing histidine kinase [Phormidium sp. FACHB-77]MBD2028725.1 HAMP domain-containing histidine kinase [Phormidium sp. FACHB-322]MBD2051146.1 HAMP domain-containing histidine kinase [Leptolyngbya sp. FACHB-60]